MQTSDNLSEYLELIKAKAGNMFVLKSDKTVSEDIRNIGHWAWDHVEIFKSLLDSDGVFLDVGSFIGHHSVAILNLLSGGGKVIAVEGQPDYARICRLNLEMQKFKNWEVIECVAGETDGLTDVPRFNLGAEHNFGSLSILTPQAEFGTSKVKVEVRKLDGLLGEQKISFIKIDVQTAELFVIRGLRKTITECKPHIFVEMSPYLMKSKAGYDFRSVYIFLIGLGYVLFDVLGNMVSLDLCKNPDSYASGLEWDVLAIHNSNLGKLRNIPWMV
jgi:FkbM family methyltransferase